MSSKIVFVLFLLIFVLSCTPTSKVYRTGDKEKYLVGDLTEIGYNKVKQISTLLSKTTLSDTLIIRYDYNYDSCWTVLDFQSDEYVQSVVTGRQTHIQTEIKNRPGITVFSFRENGNNISKLKKWDNTIIIDAKHELFNLLFYNRSRCGNSMIVMPDRKYILTRSDSHFDALRYTKERIGQLLLP